MNPTPAQLRVIGFIEDNLSISFTGSTMSEARSWISEHIARSKEASRVQVVRWSSSYSCPTPVGNNSHNHGHVRDDNYLGLGEDGYFDGNRAHRDNDGTYHVYGEPDVGCHFGKRVEYHEDPDDEPTFGGRSNLRDSDGM